jgi:hypothetical protein
MKQPLSVPLRLLVAALAILVLAPAALPVQGQPSTGPAQISIDSPTEGTILTPGSPIIVGGWAADLAGPGTGVDAVRVYLDGPMDAGGTLLGNATYGSPRQDVAAALGTAAVASSGYDYRWTIADLSGGPHVIYIYAHSIGGAWSFKTVSVTAPAQPTATPTPAATPVRGQPGFLPSLSLPSVSPSVSNEYRGGYDAGMPCLPPRGPGGPPCLPQSGFQGQPGYGRGSPGGVPIVPIKSPGSLTPIEVTSTSVHMSWSIVSGAVSYRVFMAIAGESSAPFPVSDNYVSGATVENLNPGTTYSFQVVAIDAMGNLSPPSRPMTVTTDPL